MVYTMDTITGQDLYDGIINDMNRVHGTPDAQRFASVVESVKLENSFSCGTYSRWDFKLNIVGIGENSLGIFLHSDHFERALKRVAPEGEFSEVNMFIYWNDRRMMVTFNFMEMNKK